MEYNKNLILIFLAVMAISILVLSASLPSLELKPGRRVSMGINQAQESYIQDENGSEDAIEPILKTAIRITFFILGIVIPVLIIYGLRFPDIRRRFLRMLVFGVIIFAAAHYLQKRNFSMKMPAREINFSLGDQMPVALEQYVPDPPQWLVLIASFLISAFILGIGIFIWRKFRARSSPLEQVAEEARKTIDEIRSGVDLKEGIIKCYYEMTRVLSEERGLKRRQTMTTREFEKQLEEAGLVSGHVKRLTRLFELVRYGSKDLGEREEREALDCLSAIAEASKESS